MHAPFPWSFRLSVLLSERRKERYMSKPEIEKMIQKTKAAMQKAAKELDFIEAARLRDEMFQLEKKRDEMK